MAEFDGLVWIGESVLPYEAPTAVLQPGRHRAEEEPALPADKELAVRLLRQAMANGRLSQNDTVIAHGEVLRGFTTRLHAALAANTLTELHAAFAEPGDLTASRDPGSRQWLLEEALANLHPGRTDKNWADPTANAAYLATPARQHRTPEAVERLSDLLMAVQRVSGELPRALAPAVEFALLPAAASRLHPLRSPVAAELARLARSGHNGAVPEQRWKSPRTVARALRETRGRLDPAQRTPREIRREDRRQRAMAAASCGA